MWRVIGLAIVVMMGGSDRPASVKDDLVFLTRDGCVNTPQHWEVIRPRCADRLSNADAALEGQGHLRDARP
jgi:hypothetical protein